MFFKIMRTRKGFTIVELLVVVAILGIIVAVGVPMYSSAAKMQKKKDCQNQRIIIETLVKEAMTGMMDNGKAQYKLVVRETTKTKRNAGDYAYKNDPSGAVIIDFSRDSAKAYTKKYVADKINGNGDDAYNEKPCFVLEYENPFTLGALRGGYLDNAESYKYAIYGKIANNDGDLPDEYGYYLKKKDLKDVPFYTYFAQQGSDTDYIPVCPFGKEYKYYIFEDGSVICSCPDCHE